MAPELWSSRILHGTTPGLKYNLEAEFSLIQAIIRELHLRVQEKGLIKVALIPPPCPARGTGRRLKFLLGERKTSIRPVEQCWEMCPCQFYFLGSQQGKFLCLLCSGDRGSLLELQLCMWLSSLKCHFMRQTRCQALPAAQLWSLSKEIKV